MARPKTSRASNGPSQFKSNIELRHRFRFTSTSSTLTPILDTNLLCAAGTVATLATTVTSFFGSVKVNRVEIWTPPPAQGDNATCSVEWTGSNNSPNREYSDTSVSVATPAYVSCSPPPMSLASFWQTDTGNTIFNLIAPIGSIIDVHLSLILFDEEANFSATDTVVGATVGLVYYLALDGALNHRFPPISLTTIN